MNELWACARESEQQCFGDYRPWAFPLYTVNSNRIKATFSNCRLFCFNVKSFDSNNFSKMPCCCKTNVEAASIIGKVFIFLSLFSCLQAFSINDKEIMIAEIVTCISGAFVNGILVYGADKRNINAILIWIILQIIGLVGFTILALGFIFALRSVEDLGFLQNWKFYFIIILIFVGVISFPIWTVLVAIRVFY